MEKKLRELEKDLAEIKRRNLRVEADKAWEISTARIISIMAVTYVIAAFIMYFIGVGDFWRNAFVPVLGYYLSTRSLPIVKRLWIEKFIQGKH